MAVEIGVGLSLRQSRRLRRSPEAVYVHESGGSEIRVAVVRSGEAPYRQSLIYHRFDLVNGRWRPGSQGGVFSNNDASRRSVAIEASQKGFTRTRMPE